MGDKIDKKIKKQLAADRKRRAEQSMSDKCYFTLKHVDDTSYEMTDKLNRLLGSTGARFSIEHKETPDGYESDTLVVSFKPEQVRYKTKRAAGRRKAYISYEMDGVTYRATVNRVRALIDEHGAMEAAKIIGMNKSGMYKRLKSATESGLKLRKGDADALGEDDILF